MAEKYDRDLEDIFKVQDKITLIVVGALEPELAEAEREKARSKVSQNLAAWDFCQRGMSLIMDSVTPFKQGKMSNTKEAKELFEEAIQQDPNLSAAYSGLALSYMYSILFGNSENLKQDIEDGITIARRAVELDIEDAFARIALGTMYWVKREHDLALPQFKTAIDLNPSSGWAYSCCGKSLAWMGHSNEAMTYLLSALELRPRDPQSGATMVGIAEVKLKLGDYEEAVDWAEKSLLLPGTGMWGNTALITALGHLGHDKEAEKAIDELYNRKPDIDITFVKENLPITDAEFKNYYIEGLIKAGLPDCN